MVDVFVDEARFDSSSNTVPRLTCFQLPDVRALLRMSRYAA